MKHHSFAGICLMIASLILPTLTQANTVQGNKDHPLIGPYPGTKIVNHLISDYDEAIIPLEAADKNYELGKHIKVEGKITSNVYSSEEKFSTLKVIRSYERSMNDSGFETLFQCAAEGCGNFLLRSVFKSASRKKHVIGLDDWGNYCCEKDWRLIVGKKTEKNKNIYGMVIAVYPNNHRNPLVFIEVVEQEAFQAAKISNPLESLSADIEKKGSAALNS